MVIKMGNKTTAYKVALKYVFNEIKKQGWLPILISIVSLILPYLLDGNLTNAILSLITISGMFILVIFIWSFFYILEEYGKTLAKSDSKKSKQKN